jgi:diguanylate cyclase (GGDEF)-like protein/PAS domain S-box-containing protein
MRPSNGSSTPITSKVLDQALLSLAEDSSLWQIPLQEALERITEVVARALKAKRTSIWKMLEQLHAMEVIDLYESTPDRHTQGQRLLVSENPGYFTALQQGRIIDAMDARQDYRTRELTESYLEPHAIDAMLNASLWIAGETHGVLCIEQVGSQRLWTDAEKRFAVSIADLVSQLLVFDQTRQNVNRYEAILDNMPAVAYRCSPDLNCKMEYIGGTIEALTGFPREEFTRDDGRNYISIIHPGDRPHVQEVVRSALENQDSFVVDYRILRQNGEIRWLQEQGRANYDTQGKPVSIDGVISDITERHNIESQLREVSANQQAVLDASNYSVISTDLEGTITGFNKAAERMLGYSAEELIGKATPAIFHDINEVAQRAEELSQELGQEVKPGFDVFVLNARQTGKAEDREWTYIRKDGSRFPCFLSVTAILAADGTHYGYLGVGADISERKTALEALKNSQKQLAQAQAIAHLGYWDLDLTTGKAIWSDEEYRLLGYEPGEVESIPDNLIARLHPDDRDITLKTINACLDPEGSGSYEVTFRVILPDQTERILLEKGEVSFDDQGTPFHMFGTTLDITERTRAEDSIRASENRYRALFEASGDSIFVMREDHFVDCNDQTLQMFGCSYDQIIGETPVRFSPKFQPDGRPSMEAALEKIEAAFKGEVQQFEWQHLRYDGTPFEAEVTLTFVEINGQPNLLATVRDITKRKKSEAELKKSRQQLLERNESLRLINQLSAELHGELDIDAIAQKTLDILLTIESQPQIAFYVLDPLENLLRLKTHSGFDKETTTAGKLLPLEGSLSGTALKKTEILTTSDIMNDPRLEPDMKQRLVNLGYHSAVVIPLIFNQRPLGTINMVFSEEHPFKDTELNTLSAIGTTVSLAMANARQLRDFEHQAQHDSLTGLANRSLLHKRFKKLIKSDQGALAPISTLMLMDLDRFKDINDTLGHHVGDLLLRQISLRLKAVLGERKGLVARLGGDEFTLLLSNVSDLGEIKVVSEEIQNDLSQPYVINNMMLEVGVSIGIALYPRDGRDSHELLRSADVAMYQAKKNKTGVEYYDQSQDSHSVERLAIMNDLNSAIRDNQLVLHYQPKVDIRNQDIIGFEALVRWQHPELGLLMPDDFIPFAEISDTIFRLTQKVMELALQQQRKWRDQGKNYSVAINLSARNLHDNRCVDVLKSLLHEYQTDPGLLELEITETALMQDPEHAISLLSEISDLGVQLSVDDFGTGYSSLAYLKRLPINALKIDRTFVKDMVDNEQDSIIVRSTVGLAQNLGLKVIAEGVEEEKSLILLSGMGCDQAQGYYICKPMPWDKIDEWIEFHQSWKK